MRTRFGPAGEHVSRILRLEGQPDADLRHWFALLAGGKFKFDQLLSLAPTVWEDPVKGLTYRIAWFPMQASGTLRSVIMTLTDITQKLADEKQARHAEERARLVLSITSHREHFAQFIARVRGLVPREAKALRAQLHDLKGLAGIFGFTSFVTEVSAAENRIKVAGVDAAPILSGLREWFEAWLESEAGMLKRLRVFAPAELTVELGRLEQVRQSFARDARGADLSERIFALLTAPNLASALARFEDPVARNAEKLGKAVSLEISPACAQVYLESSWSPVVDGLIHLLNNAVDHGIESLADRRAVGKPESGRIVIRAEDHPDELILVTADDGRGVDVSRLREVLSRRGVATRSMSDEDVTQAIFLPDVSTKDIANDLSGQGVGLHALSAQVRAVGGTLTVSRSEWGGAQFTISLPRRQNVRLAA